MDGRRVQRLGSLQTRWRELDQATLAREHGAPLAVGRVDHDARVAVEQPEFAVVLGDQQRPAGVVAGAGNEALDRVGEPALDAGRPARDAVRAATVGAQQAKAAKCVQSGDRVAGAGGSQHRPVGGHGALAQRLERVGVPQPDDRLTTPVERGQSGAGVAGADGVGERRDLTSVAIPALEHDDAFAKAPARGRPVGSRSNYVAQNRAGLDRGQLSGVADEHHARVGARGFQQPRHQPQRHHRALVDDHDVVGETVAGVVAEATRPGSQEPVDGARLQLEQLLSESLGDREAVDLVVHRFLHPRGRLAGEGAQRDQWRRLMAAGRQFRHQRGDPRDCRRLTGPRAAGDHGQPANDRAPRRLALDSLGLPIAKQPDDRSVEVGVLRRRYPGPRRQRRREGALLAPVAVEVEPRAEQSQRPWLG